MQSSQSASLNDSLAHVLGKEHSGRVQGLGFGPSPNQVFGTTTQFSGTPSSSNNTSTPVIQYVKKLEEKLETSQQEIRSLKSAMAYIFTNIVGNVPLEFAAMLNTMVC